MTKALWAISGLIIGVAATYCFFTLRMSQQPVASSQVSQTPNMPMPPAALPVNQLPVLPSSTPVASPQAIVSTDPADMHWFYERFGESTWLDPSKFDVKTFTMDEYHLLIEAAKRGNESAAVALSLSILKYLKEHPDDTEYQALKTELYSKDFLLALQLNQFQEMSGQLPDQVLNDKGLFMQLVQKNPYFLQFASENLRGDKELAETAMQRPGGGYLIKSLSPKLLGDKQFVLAHIHNRQVELSMLKGNLNDDKEVVSAILKDNPYSLAELGPHLKNDPEILSLIRADLIKIADMPQGDIDVFEGFNIQAIPEKLRGDKELMLKLVPHTCQFLSIASAKLKDDEDVVTAAMASRDAQMHTVHCLDFASERLQKKIQSSGN